MYSGARAKDFEQRQLQLLKIHQDGTSKYWSEEAKEEVVCISVGISRSCLL